MKAESGKILRLLRFLNGLDRTPWETDIEEDGGPGSGNWGHRGRPGKVGGSGKGGGTQYRGGRGDIAFHGSRRDWLNGLTGERQREAQAWIKRMRTHYSQPGEAEKSVEQNIMEDPHSGSDRTRAQLLDFMSQARGWDKHARRLIDENWDERDAAIAGALALKYGIDGDLSLNIPDDADTSQWEADDLRCWQDLKSKAMGGPVSGKEAPDELQYAAGLKERPKNRADTSWALSLPDDERRSIASELRQASQTDIQESDFNDPEKIAAAEKAAFSRWMTDTTRVKLGTMNAFGRYICKKWEAFHINTLDDLEPMRDRLTPEEFAQMTNLGSMTYGFRTNPFNALDYENASERPVNYAILFKALGGEDLTEEAKAAEAAVRQEDEERRHRMEEAERRRQEERKRQEEERKKREEERRQQAQEKRKQQQAVYRQKSPGMEARLRAAKNETDVQNIMSDCGMFRQSAVIDLDHMGADQAARTALGMRAVFEKYPFLVGAISSIRPDAGGDALASCSTYEDGTPLHINEKYYSTQRSHDSLDVLQRDAVSTQFHPAGTESDGVKATIVHELGHALDGYISQWLSVANRTPFVVGHTIADELRRSVAKACGVTIGKKHHRPMIEALSDYGTYNAREWFAECFCEAICSPNPRPMAREFMRQLDEIIRKNSIQ